jgi:hypothetical protein
MNLRRSAVALLACLLAGGLLAAPASARSPADPGQSQVRGGCTGGPGRISLTVSPRDDDGSVRVDVVATRLPDGPRWFGLVAATSDEGLPGDLGDREFRRTASGDGWTVSAMLRLGEYTGPVSFDASAFERGSEPFARICSVSVSRARPLYGIGWCSLRVIHGIFARRAADGSLVVHYLQTARPDTRWRLEIRARGMDGTTSVVVDDRADRHGFLLTKVVLTGVNDPGFSVTARGPHGSYCSIGLDPARLSAPLPDRAEMLRAIRDMRRMADRGL